MKWAKILAIVGIAAMGAALIYGFTQGDLREEGAIIGSIPWGVVSLVDVYVGFFLFSGWILYREKMSIKSILWVVFVMILGNFTASLYTLLALLNSNGDWTKFWLGNNYKEEMR